MVESAYVGQWSHLLASWIFGSTLSWRRSINAQQPQQQGDAAHLGGPMHGHHMDPSSKSALTYARESYTSLYAKVLQMYTKIRSGEFRPDLSGIERVLQFANAAESMPSSGPTEAEAAMNQPGSVAAEELVVDSDSESSSASDVELATDLDGEGPDGDILGATEFPGVPACDLMVHSMSGLVHVVNEDSFLVCGRLASRNFKPLSEVSFAGHLECCQHCVRIFSRANPGAMPS